MADTWITHGPRVIRPLESATLYAHARQRVLASRRLRPYLETILGDHPEGDDHLRWVAKARVGEIETWAKSINR